MRRHATVSEQRLWSALRSRRFKDTKFRRQHPIGPYILDFYCAELRLAVEVDGRQHDDPGIADYDYRRTLYLEAQGIDTIRITNEQLALEAAIVEDILDYAIRERRNPSSGLRPPSPR